MCALGDFLVIFASILRQIARYLPHHRSKNVSKTHSKSSHDKFKTVSNKQKNTASFEMCKKAVLFNNATEKRITPDAP